MRTKKIYKVSKGNQSFYLSILSDSPNTVYFVTSDKIDKAKLAKIKTGPVAQIPSELQGLLDTVAPNSAGGSATADPTSTDLGPKAMAFIEPDPDNPSNEKYRAGIYSGRIAEGKSEADILAETKRMFDSATPVGSYGGGALYEIKKGSFTGYLSIVIGTTGTVIFIWTEKPS